jgi:N-acetylglucosamine-6-phosphate deacetylase
LGWGWADIRSCCPINTCLFNLSNFASISLPEALLAATYRPAQMLGGPLLRTKGQLKEGYDADLVVLGWDGTVKSTWIMGQEVYTCP